MLFTLAVGLFTSRVILNTLGVEDFGIYNVVGGIVAMFGFINSAMATSTSRHLTYELGTNNIQQLIKVFNLSIYIHGIISLIVVILCETIGLYFLYTQMQIPIERMNAALWVYQLSIASSVITIMSVPYNAAIIAHEKMSAFAYITILDITLKLLIVYMILMFPWDKLIIYAILLLIAQIINQSIYMIYCRKKFIETKILFIWDKSLFKEMSSFAGWNLVGNIAVLTYTEGLNILLNVFFGPATNAARGIAVQVQNVIRPEFHGRNGLLHPHREDNHNLFLIRKQSEENNGTWLQQIFPTRNRDESHWYGNGDLPVRHGLNAASLLSMSGLSNPLTYPNKNAGESLKERKVKKRILLPAGKGNSVNQLMLRLY